MSVGVERAAHRGGRARGGLAGRGAPSSARRRAWRQLGEHLGAALAADLDEEAVAARRRAARSAPGRSPAVDARAGVHRDAEARAARARAVDRDEERVAAARLVVGVDVAVAHEDAVLDRDGVQVARAHADERVAGAGAGGSTSSAPSAPRRARQTASRGGKRKRLSESWPTVWAKSASSSPRCEPVGAALLDVDPAGRAARPRCPARRRRCACERTRGPDHRVAALAQRAEERVELGPVDDRGLGVHRRQRYISRHGARQAAVRSRRPRGAGCWHRRQAARTGDRCHPCAGAAGRA